MEEGKQNNYNNTKTHTMEKETDYVVINVDSPCVNKYVYPKTCRDNKKKLNLYTIPENTSLSYYINSLYSQTKSRSPISTPTYLDKIKRQSQYLVYPTTPQHYSRTTQNMYINDSSFKYTSHEV